jgi:hypothetical protein
MQPDFVDTGDSGQVDLGVLFNSVGISFSDKKRQRPDSVQEELGAIQRTPSRAAFPRRARFELR